MGTGLTTGGGLIRDVLAGSTALLMRRELHAVPITVGCTPCVILLPVFPEEAVPIGAGSTPMAVALRAAAIHGELSVALWLTARSKSH